VTSDLELLERWRANDKQAGAELFDRHYQALLRFFRNKIDEGYEDLVQATFLACVETRDRFRGDSSFRTYLFSVARNLLHKHYRSLKRRQEPLEHLDFEVTAMRDLIAAPSSIVAHRAEQRLLLEGLRRIPLDHQIVLELYFWEPLRARDIAQILDIPVGTVRTRIRRAKQLLEHAIEQLADSRQQLESTLTRLDDWAQSVRRDLPT
jgi:RNA polymerase sigma-70 factor (ECF subfamily)